METSGASQSQRVAETLRALTTGSHRAGTLNAEVLKQIVALLPDKEIRSVETGCGKSTILFSCISSHHTAFCYDDRDMENSSVAFVLSHPLFAAERTSFVFGPTQQTLPTHKFADGELLDLVLIDGPHGFPFPDLEYWHLYPRLAPGALLVIDDLMIPSIGRMYDILREDRMFDEVAVFATTGVLRRSHEPALPQDGDHWWEQAYNYTRFPMPMARYRRDPRCETDLSADLSDKAAADRYCIRGFEFRGVDGVATIDTSAMLRFRYRGQDPEFIAMRLALRVENFDSIKGGGVVVNGARLADMPIDRREFNIELRCPVASDDDYWVELRLPAAKPIHDRKANLDFRRDCLHVRRLAIGTGELDEWAIRADSEAIDAAESLNTRRDLPADNSVPETAVFVATLHQLANMLEPDAKSRGEPPETVPAPVLCPSGSSKLRFMPLPGCKPPAVDSRLPRLWTGRLKSLRFVDLFAFEGPDFAYAVSRSLLQGMPKKQQLQIAASGSVGDKLMLVFEAEHRGRKLQGSPRIKGLSVPRAVFHLWRACRTLRFALAAKLLQALMESQGQSLLATYAQPMKERRAFLEALNMLSARAR